MKCKIKYIKGIITNNNTLLEVIELIIENKILNEIYIIKTKFKYSCKALSLKKRFVKIVVIMKIEKNSGT